MPSAGFEKDLNLPKSEGRYVKLAKKGDKIRFRIAATPHYETKHFLPDGSVVLCQKYNSEDPTLTCKYCDDFATAVQANDEAGKRQFKPVTNFYYPILNMETGKPQIFQFSAKSIHYSIKNYADKGVDVFGCDWEVERTEDKKTGYYSILRLGDKPLTKEQEAQMDIAKKFDLSGKKESSSVVGEEEGKDEENEEDIPF